MNCCLLVSLKLENGLAGPIWLILIIILIKKKTDFNTNDHLIFQYQHAVKHLLCIVFFEINKWHLVVNIYRYAIT